MGPQIIAELTVARDHFKNNRLAEAERELGGLLARDPSNPFALTLLAGIRFRSGQLPEADAIAELVLATHPGHSDALGLLAIVRKTQGKFDSAADLFARLVSLGNESADLYSQLGACRLESGDFVGAGLAFRRAIELDRKRPDNYYNLGLALKMSGTNFETFITFKRAVQLDPARFEGYVQLWESMRKLLNWEEGLASMEHGLKMHPDSQLMKLMLAITFGKVGQKEEAEKLFLESASDPDSALPYAHWLQEEGRFEESIPVLKEALRLKPVQGQAYYNLAMAKHFDIEGKAFIDHLPNLLKEHALGDEQQMFLYYALAKSYEQDGNYELAMFNYDLANKKAFGLYISNREGPEESEFETVEKIYTKERIERLAPMGSKSQIPIFIVGMIRTGTTLLDQILSSHRSVSAAGELPFWQITAGRFNRRWLQSEPTVKDFQELETGYLSALHAAGGEALRVSDKMPTNFWHIGMMTLAFPNARFIHIRRSPIDTALSIYTTFLGNGTQFAYDRANIVEYYRAYLQVMAFWREVVPATRILEIDYEELVGNKERVIRQVLDFCGLPWDPACLDHDRRPSHVSTPSLFTARQPVNTASVDRWKRYEPWLGELLELRDLTHPPKTPA
jgi:tetratricopeptide (TPR) repeat protein